MSEPLKLVGGPYGWTATLRDELAKVGIEDVTFLDVAPLPRAFRQMCREQSYDVCEMALVTYWLAHSFGLPFTAIPVFPLRCAELNSVCTEVSGMDSPADLVGRRVGVRAYTVTGSVWARAFYASEFDLDLTKVTWVSSDEEHVAQFHDVAPVYVDYRVGANLDELLLGGYVDCVLGSGALGQPGTRELVTNAAQLAWAKRMNIYPINHTVVVRDVLLEEDPSLAGKLYQAFANAKTAWLDRVSASSASPADQEVLARRPWVGDDPMPYGIDVNLPTLSYLAESARAQQIPCPSDLKASFAPV